MRRFLIVTAVVLWIGTVPVFAVQPDANDQSSGETPAQRVLTEEKLKGVYEVLLVFIVLSVVFEIALTPLFNWRIFLAYCSKKGFRTPITVGLAFAVFLGYDLDIFRDLLVAMGIPAKISLPGQLLTAMLIAGGSSGVFEIFTKLHIRMNPKDREAKIAEAQSAVNTKPKS
jgi:hypothetical protein